MRSSKSECTKRAIAAALILAALWMGFSTKVAAFEQRNDDPPKFRDRIVLLAFNASVPPVDQDSILASIGATELKRLGVDLVVVDVGSGQVLGAIQKLKAHHQIRYAEPDYLQDLDAATMPNDTYIGIQWAVHNTGQTVNQFGGTAGADERTLAAWGTSTGTNSVVVATLDTGIQYSHPDLLTNIWNNPGGINGCAAGTHGYNVLTSTCDPMDDDTSFNGHGSHVAGILGAVGNNGTGVAGVNWTTSIMSVKWVPGSGAVGATSDLISAMDWVIRAKQAGINVRVVNDSATWAGTGFSQALSDEIDLLGTNNILFVTAAGNTSQNNDTTPRYPCSYDRPNMICVAASDQNDNLASFSNFGATTVKLAAPGVNIWSTLRSSNYGYISGGSMASPQVAGTAALILSLGDQTLANLKSLILTNVDPLPSLSGLVQTGGRLNVCKALPGCQNAVTQPPAVLKSPVITGVIKAGSILGASSGIWSGVPTGFAYQWYRCDSGGLNCSPITGATSESYAALAAADVGATLAVSVKATNASGSLSQQSSPTSPLASASSPFAISSSIQNGATISGSINWQATPSQAVNFIQFYIDGVLSQTQASSPYSYNAGTTGLLDTIKLSNGTHVLGFEALSTDNKTYGFFGETITVANGPANTALPVVSGRASQGQTLATTNGTWTGNPTSFSYQWLQCDTSGANCKAIAGATANTYLVSASNVGSTLRAAVTATNAQGSTTANSAPTAVVTGGLSITTTSLPNGSQNHSYSATLTATGGTTPYTWSITAGSLPAGLSLASSSGIISGTPTSAGSSSFTVQVTDATSQAANTVLTITITGATGGGIALVQSKSAEGTAVGTLSASFSASNTQGNLIIAFLRLSTSSQTVTVTDSAGNTYVDAVSQAQTTDGHQIHLFYAKNVAGHSNTVTASFSGTNNHPWLSIYEYSGLSATSPLDQTAKAQGSGTAVSAGPTGQTASANELVFAGAGFTNNYSGTVTAGTGYTLQGQDTGTSRAVNEALFATSTGTFTGTFSLSSSANWSAVVATFSSTAAAMPPSITTTSLANGKQNTAYTAQLSATGGTTPYTWSIASGTLPAGLSLAAGTGVISGTPTGTGTSNFTAKVTDAKSQSATQALTITISASGGTGISLIQSNSMQSSSVSSLAVPFSSANTGGSLIIAFVRMSTTSQTVTVSDSAGNTYTDAVAQSQATDGHQTHVFYAKNVVGRANTVTATFSASNGHPWVAIYEYSGLSTTSPLDVTAKAQGSGTAVSTGAGVATSSANELLFAGAGLPSSYSGTASAGAGYTLQRQNTSTSRAANEAAIVTATGSYSGTFTISSSAQWSAVLATFHQ